jgi:hypothetical protein
MHHSGEQDIHLGDTKFGKTTAPLRVHLHLQDEELVRSGGIAILHICRHNALARNDQSYHWFFNEEEEPMIIF